MNKENYFISQISKDSKKSLIGDDGVLVDGFIYSQDAFFENIHFKRSWMSLDEIAYKSMIVNISDAIAMNGVPLYALLTVAIPKSYTREEIALLASGFRKCVAEFGVQIIGGDTISNTKLDISITIISKPNGKLLERKGLKKRHLLAYSGNIGECKKELKNALRYEIIKKKSKLISPKLNPKFVYEIAPFLSCGMDISDGLFFELERISKINRLDFSFFRQIPKSAGCSGEEYELVFGFDKKYEKKIENIAKKHKTKITIFAKAERGSYKHFCKGHHF